MSISILSVLLLISIAISIYLYNRYINQSYQLSGTRKEINDTKLKYLNSITSVDSLINMLIDLQEFGLKYSPNHNKQTLSKMIVDYSCKILKTNVSSLMLIDETSNELIIAAAKGLSNEIMDRTRLKIGEGIAGLVARNGKHVFVEDIEKDPRFFKAENLRYPAKSFISVPLKVRNKVIGVLNVNKEKEGEKFTERDLRLLQLLAGQAAITVENIELYQNLQRLYLETMQTLAKAIDAKDAYTREHADRSGSYAKLVAEELHLPKSMIKHIEYAAMMHDIGKIGIKEEILLKPTKLTEAEREEIKKHPLIGEKIIAPIEFLAPIAPLILYHHEWFDGTGYAEGLVGEEIPIGARIVAVIDAYDAMTSDRPYRKALPKGVAVKELKKGAGTQFDPKIVDAFLRVLEQNKELETAP
ncbi:MAG TPA: HD-GYP domain-containing protein [Elusimicrobia bacterium]|nr:HD-GYP domain-containing protein [Elusimicrobiota bacterium]